MESGFKKPLFANFTYKDADVCKRKHKTLYEQGLRKQKRRELKQLRMQAISKKMGD